MGRWEPGTRERLQEAALELFIAHGYEQTTTAEIAQAVGVSERTFFRHFADKREVIFSGQDALEQLFVEGLDSAPAASAPLDLAMAALRASAVFFPDERRKHARRRLEVIAGNPALQERELLKMAALGTALAAALWTRGVPEPDASLAAQSAVTVFGVAFRTWTQEHETRSLDRIEDQVRDQLSAVTGSVSAG